MRSQQQGPYRGGRGDNNNNNMIDRNRNPITEITTLEIVDVAAAAARIIAE